MRLFLILIFIVTACQNEAASSHTGRALLVAGKYQEAAAFYTELKPQSAAEKNARWHGMTIASLNSATEAATGLPTDLAMTNRQKAFYYYDLGNYFLKNRLFREAVNSYRQALIFYPGWAPASHNLQLALLPKTKPVVGEKQDHDRNRQATASEKPTDQTKASRQNDQQGMPLRKEPTPATNTDTTLNNQSYTPLNAGENTKSAQERWDDILEKQPVLILVPATGQRHNSQPFGPQW